MSYLDLIVQVASGAGVVNLAGNLVTMFIDDKKVAKANNVIQKTVKVLNFISLNVLKNANKGSK